jgi:drug/metabolite transporter (DMT)-like permease
MRMTLLKKKTSLHDDDDDDDDDDDKDDDDDGELEEDKGDQPLGIAMTTTTMRVMTTAPGIPTTTTSSSSTHTSKTTPTPLWDAIGFFTCMVFMELALEGAFVAFPDPTVTSSLPYAVTIFQFACCFGLPVILSRGEALASFPRTLPACVPYISLSVVVLGSTFLASLSVRYVSYPTKVVFKSAKLIPTMMVATLLQQQQKQQQKGSNYTRLDYMAAALLCAGAAGYGWRGGGENGGSGDAVSHSSSYTGIILLLVSVCCDAFTPNIQQRLMAPSTVPSLPMAITVGPSHGHPHKEASRPLMSLWNKVLGLFLPTTNHHAHGGGGGLGLSADALMTNANGIGCIGLVVVMTFNGSLWEAIRATMVHPLLLVYLMVIGMALATAVWCYTRLIQQAGSVVAVAVATLRKVVTVVLSYIIYPKTMTMIHAASGVLVLGGILLSSYSKQQQQQQRRRKQQQSMP